MVTVEKKAGCYGFTQLIVIAFLLAGFFSAWTVLTAEASAFGVTVKTTLSFGLREATFCLNDDCTSAPYDNQGDVRQLNSLDEATCPDVANINLALIAAALAFLLFSLLLRLIASVYTKLYKVVKFVLVLAAVVTIVFSFASVGLWSQKCHEPLLEDAGNSVASYSRAYGPGWILVLIAGILEVLSFSCFPDYIQETKKKGWLFG